MLGRRSKRFAADAMQADSSRAVVLKEIQLVVSMGKACCVRNLHDGCFGTNIIVVFVVVGVVAPVGRQIAVVCFFRNSKSYAYAAVVSAITAVMMFTGSDSVLGESGEEITLARIVNTVLGICIYLLVEILIGKSPSEHGAIVASGFLRPRGGFPADLIGLVSSAENSVAIPS